MIHPLILLAQEGAKPGFGTNPLDFLILFLPFVLLYFLFLRPMQRKQEAEKNSMVSNMQKNDKVITTSGIYGTVISVAEKEDEVVVKVDDNVRLRMLKASILKNLSHEERVKAEKEKAKEAKAAGKK